MLEHQKADYPKPVKTNRQNFGLYNSLCAILGV